MLGITASPQEYDDYVDLLIKNPRLGHTYKAYFGDIYQLDARLLPQFDYVSLFHVGEFRTPENDAYGALTDLEMTLMLADKTKPGGEILFYSGSFAYDKAEAVGKELVKQRPSSRRRDYKSLRIFRKRVRERSRLPTTSARGGERANMSIWGLYKRAMAMLVVERRQTVLVVLSGIALGIVPIAEQVLLARVVDALALGQGAFPIIGLWAVLGLIGIIAGVIVAVTADRLAHRRRLAALGQAFEHAIILPISYHAEKGSGAVVRTILAGTDALFWNWLSFLREQFVAFVGLIVLVPTAIYMNAQMALILAALAVVYVLANVYVARRTSTDQAAVERYHNNVYGRVGDVLGNVTVVQSYARFASEMQAMRTIMAELLAAQYPVLTWWGLLTVLTRIAATITVVAIYAVGAVLVSRKQISVGEIVAFVGFAGLLIGKLDLLSGFAVRIFQYAPTLRSFFEMLDATDGVREKPDARPLGKVAGNVRYEDVTFRFKNSDQGVFDVSLDAPAGQTIALVGPTGAGKTTTLALLQRLRGLDKGRIIVDGHDIADVTLDLAAPQHGGGVPGRRPVQPLDRREHPHRPAGGERRRGRAGGAGSPRRTISSPGSPAATPSSSASAAPRSRAASASASPSPAPSSRTRRS